MSNPGSPRGMASAAPVRRLTQSAYPSSSTPRARQPRARSSPSTADLPVPDTPVTKQRLIVRWAHVLPGVIGGLDHCLHLFQGGPHAVLVGAAAGGPGDLPVQAGQDGVGQLERLGDAGAVRAWLELVAPCVHSLPAWSGDGEGELTARVASRHRAHRPVHRSPPVAPHMTAETRSRYWPA